MLRNERGIIKVGWSHPSLGDFSAWCNFHKKNRQASQEGQGTARCSSWPSTRSPGPLTPSSRSRYHFRRTVPTAASSFAHRQIVYEISCHSGTRVMATSVLRFVSGKAERSVTVCASVSLYKMRVLQDPVGGSFLQFVTLLKSSNTKDFTENGRILIFYCKNLKNQISTAGLAFTELVFPCKQSWGMKGHITSEASAHLSLVPSHQATAKASKLHL